MAIKDHGLWEGYTPTEYPEGAPKGMVFCRRVGDGVDWYDYIAGEGNFAPDTVKFVVEVDGVGRSKDGPVIRVAVVEPDRMFPQDCRVVELPGVTRLQNEKALREEFSNRFIDLQTGKIGEAYTPPKGPILSALENIMERLERLERK